MAQTKMLCVALAAVFFGLVLPCCSALKCYECNMCEDGERGSIEECSLAMDVCMKISLGGVSMKNCAYRAFCVDGDVELGITDVAKNTLKDFVDHVIGAKKENKVREVVHCCRSDYCNAASTLIPATALLLLVPLVVGPLLA